MRDKFPWLSIYARLAIRFLEDNPCLLQVSEADLRKWHLGYTRSLCGTAYPITSDKLEKMLPLIEQQLELK